VVEDAAGDAGVGNEGDEFQPATAVRTGEDVHREHLLEKVRPRDAAGRRRW